jgi:N utilization substance protein A
MKGSRVQAIIRELRGEKIDIIEWSDEPSVFAANALSPAKVNQVRITDIERRQMEVIVNDDQLSLAIGKRGQNVRLATKLVGWNIDIRSEEELKKEVAASLGELIASGGAVPLSALESVSAAAAATLTERGIEDIEALAATGVDDLAEMLDASLDEAQAMLDEAQQTLDVARQASATAATKTKQATNKRGGEMGDNVQNIEEQHAASVELDPTVDPGEVEPNNSMTNAGYDEAVHAGEPFRADDEQLAIETVEPVA